MSSSNQPSLFNMDEKEAIETNTIVLGLLLSIARTLEAAELEMEKLVNSGLEDTYIERCIRDIKADAFDKIDQLILDII